MRFFGFRIYVTVGGEQIQPSIVVKIRKKSTPTKKRMRRRSNAGFAGYIEEQLLACVVVEREVILRKSSYEQVHGSIVVVVPNRNAHVGLCFCFDRIGNAPGFASLLEFSVAQIVIQVISAAVVGHDQIRLPVIIEILPGCRE